MPKVAYVLQPEAVTLFKQDNRAVDPKYPF